MAIIVIIGISTALAAPTFRGWIEQENFRTRSARVFETINTVRTNAFSEKPCPVSGQAAIAWEFSLDDDDADSLDEFGVYCIWMSGTEQRELFMYDGETEDDFILTKDYLQHIAYFGAGTGDSATEFTIRFSTDKKIAVIDNDFSHEYVRLRLDRLSPVNRSNIVETDTICFHRIGAYAFLSPDGDCSEL